MERIKAFTVKKGFAKFQIIFGAVFVMIAIYSSIDDWLAGNQVAWSNVAFFAQGILFILFGYILLRNDKYYIEWDDEQLNFFFSTNKVVESIKIQDIKNVSISLFLKLL